MQRCPRKVYSYNASRNVVDIEDSSKCNLCNECVKYVQSDLDRKDIDLNRAVRIDESESKYNFTVEGTGALAPEEIVIKAFTVLRQKFAMMKEYL